MNHNWTHYSCSANETEISSFLFKRSKALSKKAIIDQSLRATSCFSHVTNLHTADFANKIASPTGPGMSNDLRFAHLYSR